MTESKWELPIVLLISSLVFLLAGHFALLLLS